MNGFKEWAVVCEALGAGMQSVILRKGGIAEGKAGFGFDYDKFCLMPTGFHQHLEKIKEAGAHGHAPISRPAIPEPNPDEIRIDYFVEVEWTSRIKDPKVLDLLDEFHIWKPDVIHERFEYKGNRYIDLAFVRVYRVEPQWRFPNSPEYGGCRSWIEIPEWPKDTVTRPVIDTDVHQSAGARLSRIVKLTGTPAPIRSES